MYPTSHLKSLHPDKGLDDPVLQAMFPKLRTGRPPKKVSLGNSQQPVLTELPTQEHSKMQSSADEIAKKTNSLSSIQDMLGDIIPIPHVEARRFVDDQGNEVPAGETGAGGYNYIEPRGRIEQKNTSPGTVADQESSPQSLEPRQNDSSGFPRISSYWSLPEARDFPILLRHFGSDWHGIAKFMTSKTHKMVISDLKCSRLRRVANVLM